MQRLEMILLIHGEPLLGSLDWKGLMKEVRNCWNLQRHQLTAANTLFNHKISRRITWHSPDGKVHNQIDFIFISRRFVTGVNRAKTRTFNKLDIGSNRDLVMITLTIKLKVNRKNSSNRMFFDLEKLKDPVIAEQYQKELVGRFALLLLLDQDPQTLCDEFTNCMFRF